MKAAEAESGDTMGTFTIAGKTVTVFPGTEPGAPVIYLNTFDQEGRQVCEAAQVSGCPPFSLVAVSGLDWNRDMAPWDAPAAFQGGGAFTGGADAYLELLLQEIVPAAESTLLGPPRWRSITGYSLAGLFALYALHQTDYFSRAASVSGSLWFPGFREYALAHPFPRRPDGIYLSVGDKECRARNSVLRTVQEHTEELHAFYQGQGIPTVFQLNPGNHFVQGPERTAAGLRWLLER